MPQSNTLACPSQSNSIVIPLQLHKSADGLRSHFHVSVVLILSRRPIPLIHYPTLHIAHCAVLNMAKPFSLNTMHTKHYLVLQRANCSFELNNQALFIDQSNCTMHCKIAQPAAAIIPLIHYPTDTQGSTHPCTLTHQHHPLAPILVVLCTSQPLA